MKCEKCGIDPQVNNELSKANLTAGWAKQRLDILTDMIGDRIINNSEPLSPYFLKSQIQEIKDKIQIVT